MMLLLSNCYNVVQYDFFPQEIGPTQALLVADAERHLFAALSNQLGGALWFFSCSWLY